MKKLNLIKGLNTPKSVLSSHVVNATNVKTALYSLNGETVCHYDFEGNDVQVTEKLMRKILGINSKNTIAELSSILIDALNFRIEFVRSISNLNNKGQVATRVNCLEKIIETVKTNPIGYLSALRSIWKITNVAPTNVEFNNTIKRFIVCISQNKGMIFNKQNFGAQYVALKVNAIIKATMENKPLSAYKNSECNYLLAVIPALCCADQGLTKNDIEQLLLNVVSQGTVSTQSSQIRMTLNILGLAYCTKEKRNDKIILTQSAYNFVKALCK